MTNRTVLVTGSSGLVGSEAAAFFEEMTPEQRDIVAQDFGCYILEVGRREFGGRYAWFEQRDTPGAA